MRGMMTGGSKKIGQSETHMQSQHSQIWQCVMNECSFKYIRVPYQKYSLISSVIGNSQLFNGEFIDGNDS